MGLLARIFAPEERRRNGQILRDLTEDYNAELRLAQQLRAHAGDAPYPHAAGQLVTLAEREEAQAERLRCEIERLGGSVSRPDATTRGGRNHWARLVADLEEDRAAGKRYLEQAIRWDTLRPDLSALLRSLEHEEKEHWLSLQDMIARADPQAVN